MELRPVGTEFEVTALEGLDSTYAEVVTSRYRVIDHVQIMRHWGDTSGEIVEAIELVSIVDRRPATVTEITKGLEELGGMR